jgi:hypothetical protein
MSAFSSRHFFELFTGAGALIPSEYVPEWSFLIVRHVERRLEFGEAMFTLSTSVH